MLTSTHGPPQLNTIEHLFWFYRTATLWAIATVWLVSGRQTVSAQDLQPLPQEAQAGDSPEMVALGQSLFFDGRLSGDATVSCASCHDPTKVFTDGLPLSKGYPGTLYFRNTPTLLNVSEQTSFYWDGRMSGDDLPSLVRDHIAEAHFMQADGRLVLERLRQVPVYQRQFREAAGGEPSYGRILNAVAAFVRTLRSGPAPLDKYLSGDQTAMSEAAVRGLELFRGKANCTACHHGPFLTDGKLHATGTPTNGNVFKEPERHITFRRFMRTIGVGECATLRRDIGYGCVTKQHQDLGKFRTPSLREVSQTAPYMHDGSLGSLQEVVAFYNDGGTESQNKSELIRPLELSAAEQSDLVDFLMQLAGESRQVQPVSPPPYAIREIGKF